MLESPAYGVPWAGFFFAGEAIRRFREDCEKTFPEMRITHMNAEKHPRILASHHHLVVETPAKFAGAFSAASA
jgi:hypothetical protein